MPLKFLGWSTRNQKPEVNFRNSIMPFYKYQLKTMAKLRIKEYMLWFLLSHSVLLIMVFLD